MGPSGCTSRAAESLQVCSIYARGLICSRVRTKTDVKREARSRKNLRRLFEIKERDTQYIFGLFVFAGTALGTKFVLLNLQRELAFSVPDDPSTRDQIQKTFFI